jgi:hypothetical protein
MSRPKVLFLAGLAAAVFLAVLGCSLMVRDETGVPAGSGWYIKLRIQAPAAAKGITVSELDVTGLQILVRDPSGEVLQTIDWEVGQGGKDYVVPVKQLGEHEIEVTHYGTREGQPVQANESAAFTIRAMKITIIDIVPGCIGVIQVEGEEPPEPVDLTGYWDAILTPTGGTENPPHLIYLKQTGSSLDGYGMAGTVEGSTVTIVVGDGDLLAVATIAPDGTINGTCEGFMTGTIELRRSELNFGTFALSGMIGLDTDRGLGSKNEDSVTYRLDFHVQADAVQGFLVFWNTVPLTPGTYSVISTDDRDPGPNEVGAFINEGSGNEHRGESGTLTLTHNDSTRASGSFSVQFEDGNSLTGGFELNLAAYSGLVTIAGGYWNGAYVPPSSANWQLCHGGSEMEWGDCEIDYLDEDLNVGLNLYPHSGPIATGTFSVPDQLGVEVYQRFDDGSGIDGEAMSGTLVITSFAEGVGIEGYFESMMFPAGTLSGSFDVGFELNDYE